MAHKKKHEEHSNHERWLVSYADFITLLFAFFVVLFSSSQVDRSKTKKMALAIEAAFSHFSMFSQTGGELNLIGSASSQGASSRTSPVAGEEGAPIFIPPQLLSTVQDEGVVYTKGDPALNENVGIPTPEAEALSRAYQDVLTVLDKRKLQGAVTLIQDDRGMVIRLRERGLFQSGSDKYTPEAVEILYEIGSVLKYLSNPVRVEGHTDNVKTRGAFPSNWELSTARSTHVVKWLLEHFDLDPARFAVMGYGEYRPLASNATEEGRDQNRRVEIVVLPDRSMFEGKNKISPEKEEMDSASLEKTSSPSSSETAESSQATQEESLPATELRGKETKKQDQAIPSETTPSQKVPTDKMDRTHQILELLKS